MAWLSTIFESLPKALIFGGLLFWVVVDPPPRVEPVLMRELGS
jgi:hypothetical protein